MPKILCTVEILTRNSAKTLERCLESVKDFSEIIILDGNSTDDTRRIAAQYGCKIVRQYETEEPNIVINDYAEVRNKGLKLSTNAWFMFIDSDEYLSSEAVEEIRSIVENPKPEAYVWWQPRKYELKGRIVECATTYPNQQVRLFHRAHIEGFVKPIHERINIKPGVPVGILSNFEYVPLVALPELETRWTRYMEAELAMSKNLSWSKLLLLSLRSAALFALYALRYLRNLFVCRGIRMPLSFEWARHKFLLVFAYKLIIL